MKRNLLYILGVVCLMTSCVEERVKEFEAAPGVEVDFNISMADGPETKTLYGAESGTSIKVNWVTGDLIEIYGTNCSVNQAEYKVTAQDTPTNVAKSLDKTVDVGVRWGDSGTSDFYALYPSDGASFAENTDGTVTLKTNISETQNNVFTLNETRTVELKETVNNVTTTYNIPVWEGTHFADDAANPSMPSAIMYACTKGAAAKDDQGNLQPVSLHFKPFTTVLKFRFMGYTSSLTDPTVYVQNIVVEAPKGYDIAGDFNLGISGTGSGATATATSANTTAKNVITLNTILSGGTYLPLKQRQAVEFNVFTMPVDGQEMGKTADENLWKITINTAQHGSFSYTLAPTADGTVYELEPGKIHKVKVPQLAVNGTIDWKPENWITQIPVPVYISELSVPGAWYAGDLGNYQGGATLTELYTKGVRAFHIDCRMTPSSHSYESFLGIRHNHTYGSLQLVCAGTDKWTTGGPTIGSLVPGNTVLSSLSEISKQIKPDEYIVVVLTICEKPLTSSSEAHGGATVDPATVIPAITKLINENGKALGVYGYREPIDKDGDGIVDPDTPINANTTIDDVLGSMIIKINTNTDDLSSYTFPTSSLVSFGSMAADNDWNTDSDKITDLAYNYFANMQTTSIFWGNTDASLKYYYHQAQMTTIDETNNATETDPIPTLKDRKAAIDAIIKNSKTIYDNAKHDAWFQMGIGGYNESNANDKASVSDALNAYLQTKIEAKMETDPSPVGIVLMNNCLDYTDLIQDIIEMNGKFYLNRQGGSITTGGQGGTDTTTPTPAPAKNAAYAVVGDDAF